MIGPSAPKGPPVPIVRDADALVAVLEPRSSSGVDHGVEAGSPVAAELRLPLAIQLEHLVAGVDQLAPVNAFDQLGAQRGRAGIGKPGHQLDEPFPHELGTGRLGGETWVKAEFHQPTD